MFTDIRAIIFDLDGTLYPMTKRFKPFFAIFSIPHPLRLPKYMKIREGFRGKARDSADQIMSEINQEIESSFGIRSGEQWQKRSFYPAFYNALKVLPKRPKINELLAKLKNDGYRLMVLSDFGEVENRLNALKIDTSHFEQLLSSEDLGGFKPNRLPFVKALNKLNLEPEQVLMVGDRPDTDGEGAQAMGMPILMVPGKTNCGWSEAVEPLWNLPSITDEQ